MELVGKLLNPVISLVVAICDGLMDVCHSALLSQSDAAIKVDMVGDIWTRIVSYLARLGQVVNLLNPIYLTAAVVVPPIIAKITGGKYSLTDFTTSQLVAILVGGVVIGGAYCVSSTLPDNLFLPVYEITPEEIFSGELAIFDVDFFNPSEEKKDTNGQSSINSDLPPEAEYLSIAYKLRPTVARWYINLRNVALVGSLSILIYIAIKIIMSSTATDKSKYKQRLYDWIVSILLIFTMHYIMAGSNLLVKQISGVLNSVQKPKYVSVIQTEDDDKTKILQALEDNREVLVQHQIIQEGDDIEKALFTKEDGKDIFIWPTNLMGIVRLQAQRMKQENSVTYAGYAVMFLILVIFTGTFIFTYLKRTLYMAFLTMIAPFVAMTYALDKLKDGSAQGFNSWFKEYMVNLIIQPIHLLLYTVLVASALELASQNLIYGIVAIAFMIPAEKLVRKFFGVSPTETQGFLGGAVGAGVVMTGLNRLLGHRPPSPMKRNVQNNEQDDKSRRIRQTESLDTNNIFKENGQQSDSGSELKGESDELEDKDKNKEEPNKTIGNNIGKTKNEENKMNEAQKNAWLQQQEAEELWRSTSPKEDNMKKQGNLNSSQPQVTIPTRSTGTTNSANNAQKRKKIRTPRIIRQFGGGIAGGAKYVGKKIPGIGAGIGRRAVRLASGAAVAAAAGGIGLAAGAATGDFSKAAQYASGAALAGYKFGSSVPESARNLARNVTSEAQNFDRAFQIGAIGEQEYNKREEAIQIANSKKEKIKNEEFIRDFSLRTNMDVQEAKEYLEHNSLLEQGLKYGFTDANEFAAIKVANDKTNDLGLAFTQAKFVKSMGSDISSFENNKKEKDNFIESLKDRYRSNGMTDEKEIEKKSRILYKDLSKVSKAYYKR